MQAKQANVKTVQSDGKFKEWDKWSVELSDGTTGKMYTKDTKAPPVTVGQAVHFLINESGTIKVVDPDDMPVSARTKEMHIIRQSSLKAAVDLCVANFSSAGEAIDSDHCIALSEKFVGYILNGKK